MEGLQVTENKGHQFMEGWLVVMAWGQLATYNNNKHQENDYSKLIHAEYVTLIFYLRIFKINKSSQFLLQDKCPS